MRQDILEGIRRHIQPLAGVEHAQILEIAPGHAKLGIDILPCSLNLYGNLHGGVIFYTLRHGGRHGHLCVRSVQCNPAGLHPLY